MRSLQEKLSTDLPKRDWVLWYIFILKKMDHFERDIAGIVEECSEILYSTIHFTFYVVTHYGNNVLFSLHTCICFLENFKNTFQYGELNPQFCHEVIQDTLRQ